MHYLKNILILAVLTINFLHGSDRDKESALDWLNINISVDHPNLNRNRISVFQKQQDTIVQQRIDATKKNAEIQALTCALNTAQQQIQKRDEWAKDDQQEIDRLKKETEKLGVILGINEKRLDEANEYINNYETLCKVQQERGKRSLQFLSLGKKGKKKDYDLLINSTNKNIEEIAKVEAAIKKILDNKATASRRQKPHRNHIL